MKSEQMRFLKYISLILLIACSANIKSQNLMPDDPVAVMLDSLENKKVLETAFNKPAFPKNNKFRTPDSIPFFDDYAYEARLAKLDAVSPFDLVYNPHVRGFIDLYLNRKRELMSRMLALSQLYYPMFEQILDRYNIPLELKHLAVIESALNPNARSKAGAQGLWQFMYPTGKMYGLSVNSYIDERSDPYKATVAAAEYLKTLYGLFNDWQMVLAAYNAGPGTISKAIRRSGGKKTYWEIRPFLPRETQGYVPAFIAANYAMTYYADHNIYPAVPKKTYFEVDTVVLKEQMSFSQISLSLDIPYDEVKYFNPQYRKDIVPAGGNALCLPKQKIGFFLTNEQEIYAAIKAQTQTEVASVVKEVQVTHIVKSGQRLSDIARKYGVSVADIKSWNYIGKKGIRPGKKLVIYVPKKEEVSTGNNSEVAKTETKQDSIDDKKLAENKTSAATQSIHKVKSGESLFGIAKRYGMNVNELMSLNGLNKNAKLSIGQKLKLK